MILRYCFGLLLPLVTVMPQPACMAATLISPPGLSLAASETTAVLTVTNQRDVAQRYRIAAFAWSQTKADPEVLTTSRDIAATPADLTLAAHETGHVTVTLRPRPRQQAERAYRVRIAELPRAEREPDETIAITTTVTVPVFVAPLNPVHRADIAGSRLRNGRLGFSVRNRGNVHAFIRTLSAKGGRPDGGQSFAIARPGWYLLAGQSLDVRATVSRPDCQASTGILVRAEFQDGTGTETPLPFDRRDCGNATETGFPAPVLLP
ncbi:MAG: fimbria/pilus periplasmic chaperone [Telmatospirillum sp.]|nr:fimbria/pilus periplasmic chaperone [Telmatospirillum sp.]